MNLAQRIFRDTGRLLSRSPRGVISAVIILVVGIAASLATLSVVDATILHPLPYSEPQTIVELSQPNKGGSVSRPFTYRFFYDAQGRLPGLHRLAALSFSEVIFRNENDQTDSSLVNVLACSTSLFDILRLSPRAGRFFNRAEERNLSANSVTVISEQFWRAHYSADPQILGQTVWLNEQPFVVIGVMPKKIRIPPLPSAPSFWIPLGSDPMIAQLRKMFPSSWDRSAYLSIWGRLDAGTNPAIAEHEVKSVASPLLAEDDLHYSSELGLRVAPIVEELKNEYRIQMYLLFAACLLVLIVSCSNASTVVLARAFQKRAQISIRQALGERQFETLARLLIEPITVAILGWLGGVLLALFMVRALERSLPDGILPFRDLTLDFRVLVFVLIASVAFAVGVSASPAYRLARLGHAGLTQGSSRSFSEHRRMKVSRQSIVALQVACATVALVVFLSLFQAYRNVSRAPLGFDPNRVVVVDLTMLMSTSSGRHWKNFDNSLANKLVQSSGFQSATAVSAPLTISLRTSYTLLGDHTSDGGEIADYRPVGPGYFSLLHIPIQAGRSFSATDEPTSPHVCIINEMLARTQFAQRNELGAQIVPLGLGPCEIVGIVGNVASEAIGHRPSPAIYIPFDQVPDDVVQGFMTVLVRTSAGTSRAGIKYARQMVTDFLRNSDAYLYSSIYPLSDVVDIRLSAERFRALMMGVVSIIIIMLCGYGVYGITTNYIAEGRRTLTIRLALGATNTHLLVSVLKDTCKLAMVGIAIGLPVGYFLVRMLSQFVTNGSASNISTQLLISALAITVLTCLSACIAARAVLRLNTAEVLKEF